jgi:hypothetical protein
MDYQFDWKWPKSTRLVGEDDLDSKSAKKFLAPVEPSGAAPLFLN